jgi:hypothetical protein
VCFVVVVVVFVVVVFTVFVILIVVCLSNYTYFRYCLEIFIKVVVKPCNICKTRIFNFHSRQLESILSYFFNSIDFYKT